MSRDRLADGEIEGEVPRADDPDDPVGHEGHVDALVLQEVGPGGFVGQVLPGALRPEADRVAEEEELVGDDVVPRLPGLARDDVADAVLLVHEAVADPAQDPPPLGEAERGPARLGFARPRDGRGHRLAVRDRVLGQAGAGGGVGHRDRLPRGDFADGCALGHGGSSSHGD